MLYLKQSTASQSVLIGPFVDSTDGVTAETALTISNTDIRLSKNGGNIAAKNSGGGTHDENGWYTITLDATDTNTVGRLQLHVNESGALPVFAEFQVLEEDIYDALFAASAAAFDSNQRVDVGAWLGNAVTASSGNPDVNVESMDSGVVTAAVVATGAIDADAIATDAITAAKIAANAITSSELADGAITAAKFGAGAITATVIATDAIDADALAADAIAEINVTVDAALADIGLDHLISSALPTNWATDVASGSVFDNIADDGTAAYDRTTDSLQAIADSGGGGPTAAQIADAIWDEDQADHTGVGTFGIIASEIADILVDTNSLNDTKIPQTLNLTASGNIGIDWANVENPTTALDLSGTDIQLCDTVTTLTGHTAQTGDTFALANGAAGFVAIDTVVDAIKVKTDDITFTVANQVDANMLAISGDTTAADNLEASTELILEVSLSAGSHDTNTIAASDATGYGDDTFIGRVFMFRTGNLQHEAAVITDYTSSTGALEFAASSWTTSPANTDTGVIV